MITRQTDLHARCVRTVLSGGAKIWFGSMQISRGVHLHLRVLRHHRHLRPTPGLFGGNFGGNPSERLSAVMSLGASSSKQARNLSPQAISMPSPRPFTVLTNRPNSAALTSSLSGRPSRSAANCPRSPPQRAAGRSAGRPCCRPSTRCAPSSSGSRVRMASGHGSAIPMPTISDCREGRGSPNQRASGRCRPRDKSAAVSP